LSNEKGLRDAIEFDHISAIKIVKMVGDLAFINEGAINQTVNKQAVSMHSHVVEVSGKEYHKILAVGIGRCYAFDVLGKSDVAGQMFFLYQGRTKERGSFRKYNWQLYIK
jgi:hypothetical protein